MKEFENDLTVGEAIEELGRHFGLPEFEDICPANKCCERRLYGNTHCAKHAEMKSKLFKGIKALHAKHRALKGIK